MRQQLSRVRDALSRYPFDPSRHRHMLVCSGHTRDLPVCHVSDQRMSEGVLGLTLHRGDPGSSNQFLARELAKRIVHGLLAGPGHIDENARPESPSDHGGVLKKRFLGRAELVQPCRDDCLQGLGRAQSSRVLRPLTPRPRAHHDPPTHGRTPRRTTGSRRSAPRRCAAGQRGPTEGGRRKGDLAFPLPRAAPARPSGRCAYRNPTAGPDRTARVWPCTRRGSERGPIDRRCARRNPAWRRRPSGCPRPPSRAGGRWRSPRGSDAKH